MAYQGQSKPGQQRASYPNRKQKSGRPLPSALDGPGRTTNYPRSTSTNRVGKTGRPVPSPDSLNREMRAASKGNQPTTNTSAGRIKKIKGN